MKRVLKTLPIFFLMLAVLWAPTWAQEDRDKDNEDDETIFRNVSDRPFLIRARDVQEERQMVEVDFKFSRDRDGSPIKLRLPLLYRLDTGHDWEFRLQSDFLTQQQPNLGFSDLSAGFKWNFDSSGEAHWSVVGTVEVPSGSAGFAGSAVEPSITLVFDRRLSDRWNLVSNVVVGLTKDDPGRDYYGTLGAGIQIGYAVDSKTQVSAIGIINARDAEVDGITTLAAALGVSRALSDKVQCSFTLGRSFSATGDDYQFVTGVSRRF